MAPPKVVVPDAPEFEPPPVRRPPPPPPKPVAKPAPRPPKPDPTPAKPLPPPPPPAAAEPPQGTPAPSEDVLRAQATYTSKVLEEIRKHRISPNGTGSVGVSFVIDAPGVVTSASVVRSSGLSELDETALRMVRAARPGPPPDGSFARTMTINFFPPK